LLCHYPLFFLQILSWLKAAIDYYNIIMSKNYYDPADLKKFGNISDYQPKLGKKFFDYYGEVFKEGALTQREKALIALAVSHAVQCPYCIDAYTSTSLEKGADEEQMMEAIHVAAAIKSGALLVHGVQMMNKVDELTM
jgi:alkylhydroperoxidase/carboxymuconolactone decarboxylase family protein